MEAPSDSWTAVIALPASLQFLGWTETTLIGWTQLHLARTDPTAVQTVSDAASWLDLHKVPLTSYDNAQKGIARGEPRPNGSPGAPRVTNPQHR